MLLERAVELEHVERTVAAVAAGSGRLLVIEGPAGVGKTSLLESARDAAERAGLTVLQARGGELERDFGFGVVRQLFEAKVRETRDAGALFAGEARFAAPLLGVEPNGEQAAEALSGTDASFTALHGLHWLMLNLTDDGPLALVVDDVHWGDSASLRFLAYLARRIDDLPVLIVVAGRPAAADDDLRHALTRAPGAELLTLRPLTADGTRQMLEAIAPAAGEESWRACHAVTGGNPFYVHEVAVSLRDEAVDARALERWSPENLTRAVRGRLAGVSAPARELARAAAILGRRAEPRHVLALAGVSPEDASAADELREAGLFAQGREIEFLHPILRTAVYDDVPAAARTDAHGRAARLLAAEGAGPEPVAGQLLHAERSADPWACEQLIGAARESFARGAPEAAVAYLRRALEEPAPAELHFGLLVELGGAEASAFQSMAASAHLAEAFELARDPQAKLAAATLHALAGVISGDGAQAIQPLAQLLEETSADDPIRVPAEAALLHLARYQPGTRAFRRNLRDRVDERVQAGEPPDATALTALGSELTLAGEQLHRIVELIETALDHVDEKDELLRAYNLCEGLRCLMACDCIDSAMPVLDRELEAARGRGATFEWALWSAFRAIGSYRRGAIFEAEAEGRTCMALAEAHGSPYGLAAGTAYVVDCLIERGALDEAAELVDGTGFGAPPAELPPMYTVNLLLWSRGRLRTARDEAEAGLEDLLECGRREEEVGEVNPALVPWRSSAALALLRLGRGEEARELAREELTLSREFGAARAIGISLRCMGLVDADPALLEEAVRVLEDSPARLELARALADLGEARRREGQREEARETLLDALELAHRCGAAALEAQVLASLHAAGARPRRPLLSGPDALTPRERRVAELAAAGNSNREIAAQLFVTVRTVEYHLQGAYRKLGIHSRAELAEGLRSDGRVQTAAIG